MTQLASKRSDRPLGQWAKPLMSVEVAFVASESVPAEISTTPATSHQSTRFQPLPSTALLLRYFEFMGTKSGQTPRLLARRRRREGTGFDTWRIFGGVRSAMGAGLGR